MLGFLLSFVGTLFGELSVSLEKTLLAHRIKRMVSIGLIQVTVAFFIYAGYALFIRRAFLFSLASLPTFIPEAILSIFQAYIYFLAIAKADRSTFGFIRTFTVPLMLISDILLGYAIRPLQLIGIILIFLVLIFLTVEKAFSKRGRWLVVLSAINSAVSLTLYKYNITHFNSVEAHQTVAFFILFIAFVIAAIATKEKPWQLLRRPKMIAAFGCNGLAAFFEGFAYQFGVASFIMAIQRATTLFWAIIAGKAWFHEKHFVMKLTSLAACMAGIALLVLG
ncbi:MAG: hypothetical protein Q7R83_04090 [bacterium]|nr:hypothetical protein [bacterium]